MPIMRHPTTIWLCSKNLFCYALSLIILMPYFKSQKVYFSAIKHKELCSLAHSVPSMVSPSLAATDTTTPSVNINDRQALDSLISKIKEARLSIKSAKGNTGKLTPETLNYLKSVDKELNNFKAELSNLLNKDSGTKQIKLTGTDKNDNYDKRDKKAKQTNILDYLRTK